MNNLISAVKAMRRAQKEYFRTRDRQVLLQSKALEKQVDELITKYDNQQKELFNQ